MNRLVRSRRPTAWRRGEASGQDVVRNCGRHLLRYSDKVRCRLRALTGPTLKPRRANALGTDASQRGSVRASRKRSRSLSATYKLAIAIAPLDVPTQDQFLFCRNDGSRLTALSFALWRRSKPFQRLCSTKRSAQPTILHIYGTTIR